MNYIFLTHSAAHVDINEIVGITNQGKIGLSELWRNFWVQNNHSTFEEVLSYIEITIREISDDDYHYIESRVPHDEMNYNSMYITLMNCVYDSSEEPEKNMDDVKDIIDRCKIVKTWPN